MKRISLKCSVYLLAPSIWEANPRFAYTALALTIICVSVIIGMYLFLRKYRKKNEKLLELSKNLHTAEELLAKDNKIKEVNERLERIIHTAPIAYMLLIDEKIVEINEKMQETLGLCIGDGVRELYNESSDRDIVIENMRTKEKIKNTILSFKLADGKIHRCLVNMSFTEYDQEQAIVVWAIDMEHDEAQKDQIYSISQSLQNVLDALPVPVRLVNMENSTIVYVNNSFLELFKYDSAEDVCGRHMKEILPVMQSSGRPSYEKINAVLNTPDTFSTELEYLAADGGIIEALLVACHIEYHGKKCSVGIIRDLAKERRETELRNAALAAEEASRAKTAFLANMSHEIRTPMNSIIGFSELALDSSISPSTRDYLLKIRNSADGLLRIINDILDISKIEAGKMEMESIPFDMHEVFKTCQMIISPKAIEKGVTLFCYAEPSVGKKLLGDPTRLRQVLLNLLMNAVKFTNYGLVKLLSVIVKNTSDSVTMRFEVKDSGIGMTQDSIKKIFEPFAQADDSTTRQYGGTGLGLPITKNIVELMGGVLTVESTLGVGSKFSFELTFKTIDSYDSGHPKDSMPSDLDRPVFDGEILLCEDNELNRQVICEHLSRVGITTTVAVNGKEGVDIVAGRMARNEPPFDLIFMDIHMPVMDGLEAAKRLSQLGNKTPIVALTANVMSDDRDIYRRHNMPDYLAKPFRTQELWVCLLRHITPAGIKADKETEDDVFENKLKLRLISNFVKDYRTSMDKIYAAFDTGDIKLASRLAHTLKGVAGMIGRTKLAEAANVVERTLSNSEALADKEILQELDNELRAALEELTPLVTQNDQPASQNIEMDRSTALSILERLDQLLLNNDADCLDLLENLKSIQGTDKLIMQIEEYEYSSARDTLAEIMQIFIGG